MGGTRTVALVWLSVRMSSKSISNSPSTVLKMFTGELTNYSSDLHSAGRCTTERVYGTSLC